MTLSHRPLQASDAAMICAFPQSVEELFFMFPKAVYPLTPEQLLTAASTRHDPTVGLFNGQVVGYVNFFEARVKHYCVIGNLVIDPAFRRKGVARYLVNVMLQKAREQYAARFVRASCFSHNQKAYDLYHQLGFRPADMAQRLSPDGEPVLLIHMHRHGL